MKKVTLLMLTLVMLLSLIGCGGNEGQSADDGESQVPLSEADIRKLYTTPENYIGSVVDLSGVVFGTVEYDDSGVYFQMWGDPENSDMNTVVAYLDPDFELEDGQYVKLHGEVADVFEGENMLGGTIIAPTILASSLEISTYQDVVAPTVATASAATPTIDQLGYEVTVQKAELAEKETRLYVSVANNGSSEFSVYSFNMVIIQDGTQYEEEMNFYADYPELQSDILPGVTTEGIVTFPAIEQAPFQVIIEGSTYNWDEDINNYVFDMNIQE